MRIDVKKQLFIGLHQDKNSFFKQAQELGVIDFIDVSKGKEESPAVSKFISAIKILRGLPTLPQEELTEYNLADGLVYKILQLQNKLTKLLEQKRIVKLEIARISVFGDFSMNDIEFIEKNGHRKIQFFFAKQGVREQTLPEGLLYVASEHGLDYFFAINENSTQYPKFVEIRIEQSLDVLKHRDHEIEKTIHEIEQRLKGYVKYNTFLHHALVFKLNAQNLHKAQKDAPTLLDDSLFVVSGWVPVNKISAVIALTNKMGIHTEEIAIETTDAVPTYLENQGLHRLGEDLIHIYDTPSSKDKDPSMWVLTSFALFFSFIVGDGGYGLIFLAVALYLRYKFSDIKGGKRRLLNLFTLLCGACIVWGVLTSSFFGISLGPDNPIRKYSLIQWLVEKKAAYHISHQDETYTYWVNKYPQLSNTQAPGEFVRNAVTNGDYELVSKFTDNIMLELALFIGVIHILLSMFRYVNRNWVMLGWILFVIGSYLYLPHYLGATSMTQYLFGINNELAAQVGMYLIIGGLSLAILIAVFKNKLLGILEFMTAIQVFSDILSYLRLYALGLAGSIVTATINESAASLPFIFALVLILFGHGVNILLSIMSGVIHGLRLNFLEWYHYSFEGDGKQFKPLQKLSFE